MTVSTKTKKDDLGKQGTGDVPVPPDGGWGWVVTFSSFMVSVLVDGVCFSFGIFFTHFMDYFGTSKMKTSWVGSVLNGSYLILGPVVGALVTRYGAQRIAIIGAIFSSVSFFVSSFSTNIEVLTITYGLLGGIGLGFMYLPAIVMVGFYFEKKRALATGIACCGSGIGAFVFAPLCEYLLNEYNWKGAMWILSAIVLNGLIFGSFYRPVKTQTSKMSSSKGDYSNATNTTNNSMGDEFYVVNDKCFPVMLSSDNLLKSAPKHPWEFSDTPIYRCKSVDILKSEHHRKHNDFEIPKLAQSQQIINKSPVVNVKDEFFGPMQRKDIFYSGSLANLRIYKESKNPGDYHKKVYDTDSKRAVSSGEELTASKYCGCVRQFVKTNLDLSLLLSPTFSIYGLSCFLCMAGFFVPFIYIPPLALKLGISSQRAAFLISIIGIVNTVGRVLVGFISDQKWMDCLLFNNIALIIGGIATILVTFFNTFALLATYCCIFGAAIAVFVSLRSIIMVELLGLEKLTNAFGLVIMCQGLSSFIGAPIAGAISDSTGSYEASFYFAGIVLCLAGLICLPLRRIAKWEQKRNRPESDFTLDNSDTEMAPMMSDNEKL